MLERMNGRYKLYFSLFLMFMLSVSAFSQDTCATAVDLGTLPDPANCNGMNTGQGTPVINNLTNVGATAANPYTSLVDCQGNAANCLLYTSDAADD